MAGLGRDVSAGDRSVIEPTRTWIWLNLNEAKGFEAMNQAGAIQ